MAETVAKQPRKPRWQIESPTRGIYVGTDYAHGTSNCPTFVHSPSEASIVRFDDKQAAEAELARG